MIVRTMLNALLVLQLALVLLLAAAPPEDLGGTDIAELGERIMTLLELCQKKIAHSGDSISSPAPDPPDKEDSISTCRGPSQDQRRFRKSGKKSVTVTEVEKTEEPEKKTMQPRKLPARREGERQLLLWPTKKEEEEDTEKKPDAKRGRRTKPRRPQKWQCRIQRFLLQQRGKFLITLLWILNKTKTLDLMKIIQEPNRR